MLLVTLKFAGGDFYMSHTVNLNIVCMYVSRVIYPNRACCGKEEQSLLASGLSTPYCEVYHISEI